MDRGSQALEFISKPLMLDYLHVKFMCTLPHFAAKTVVQSTINEGFYKYDGFDEYTFKTFWPPSKKMRTESNEEGAYGTTDADSASSAGDDDTTAEQKSEESKNEKSGNSTGAGSTSNAGHAPATAEHPPGKTSHDGKDGGKDCYKWDTLLLWYVGINCTCKSIR